MSFLRPIRKGSILQIKLRRHHNFNSLVVENLHGLRFIRPTPFAIEAGDALVEVNHEDIRDLDPSKIDEKFTDPLFHRKYHTISIVKKSSDHFHDIYLENKTVRK